jgi:hypothetical protein
MDEKPVVGRVECGVPSEGGGPNTIEHDDLFLAPSPIGRGLGWADENLALQHFAIPTSFVARIASP